MVLVSVIIPAYNASKYLRECISSCINQRPFSKMEVIVVDDGSTDDTAKICMEYARSIKYVYKENGGTASALNAGIAVSTGDFIKWVSADDVLLDNAIAQMIDWIGHNDLKNIKNSIYYTNYHIIDKDSNFLEDFNEPGHPSSMLWNFYFGNGSTSLIHKEIFEKIGNFDAQLPHTEDYEFWLRATMLHGITLKLIPIFTLNYRRHADQLTHKVGGKLDKVIKQAIKERMG